MIHSNERNVQWGFNLLNCLCAQRYQYVTQLNRFLHLNHSVRLVNLLYFHKWYVCNTNYYSVLCHNAKQCYLLLFIGLL